jgi:formylglycine-generating enzyme required for sulfatase activity
LPEEVAWFDSVRSWTGADAEVIPGDGEAPVRPARLGRFGIGRFAVTNARYRAFTHKLKLTRLEATCILTTQVEVRRHLRLDFGRSNEFNKASQEGRQALSHGLIGHAPCVIEQLGCARNH